MQSSSPDQSYITSLKNWIALKTSGCCVPWQLELHISNIAANPLDLSRTVGCPHVRINKCMSDGLANQMFCASESVLF